MLRFIHLYAVFTADPFEFGAQPFDECVAGFVRLDKAFLGETAAVYVLCQVRAAAVEDGKDNNEAIQGRPLF